MLIANLTVGLLIVSVDLINSIFSDNSVLPNIRFYVSMKRIQLLTFVLLIAIIAACGSAREEKKNEAASDKEENATQLTYRQFYELMFEDYKNRVEWHEDDYNQEGKEAIEITDRGNCEKENCGSKVYVKNISTDQTIRVVMKTSFSIPNTLPYIANQYILAPGDEVYLTCTQFCFGGETYDLANEIVVAEYATGT